MVWGHPRLNLAHASIIKMQEPCRESLLTSLMECHQATLGFHSCIMIRLRACMQQAQRLSSPVSSTKSKFGLMMCAGTLNLGSLLQCRCSTSAWSSSISQWLIWRLAVNKYSSLVSAVKLSLRLLLRVIHPQANMLFSMLTVMKFVDLSLLAIKTYISTSGKQWKTSRCPLQPCSEKLMETSSLLLQVCSM